VSRHGLVEEMGLKRAGWFTFLSLAALALSAPAAAQDADSSGIAGREVVALKPGQFVWYESDASFVKIANVPGNGISVVVSIPAQLAYVYRDGILIAVSTVSTGREGKDTPTGEFTILQKNIFHRSNLYSNAPMPYMQRLTWDGIALHAGQLPGYPASHGCIRLPKEFAKKLYSVTSLGAMVAVVDEYIDDPRVNRWGGQPMLRVDTASLGGGTYDRVVASANEPAPSIIEAVQQQPASWVMGPAKEIVQPLPSRQR
jgi:hypothetical protein